jgi:hypothetical protein
VDELEEAPDHTDIEVAADLYASRVLVGGDAAPEIAARDYRELATRAGQLERDSGVDPGAVIYAWARGVGDYAMASMALKALFVASGARKALRDNFRRHVSLDSAAESDLSLLRCVLGGPGCDATAH